MKKVIEIAMLFLPLVLSKIFIYNGAYLWGSIVILLLIYANVIFNPQCKERENLWTFVLVTVSLFPFNFKIVNVLSWCIMDIYGNESFIGEIIIFFSAYSVIFAIQQIICAGITRVMFRRQKKLL